jgi:2-iminobutanoate/2-iminopropanoate deaminase
MISGPDVRQPRGLPLKPDKVPQNLVIPAAVGVVPALSPAFEAGNLVFVSGQLAFDGAGGIVGATVGAQTRIVLDRIENVLAGFGLSLASIVKTTVWLASSDLFAEFNAAYGERFGTLRPARSTIAVSLIPPGALVEIEAVAARSVGARSSV